MDRFIHDENLRHYQRLLERTSDVAERERILNLMAEEEAAAAQKPPTSSDRRAG